MRTNIIIGSLSLLSLLYPSIAFFQEIGYSDSSIITVDDKKKKSVPEVKLIYKDTIPLGEYDELISDHYTAKGMPHIYDALHSFNYRRVDKFGGYLNVKINEGLERVRKKGFNSDIKNLYIQIDPISLTVYWFAIVGPSTDGLCYTKIDSRGSAGGGIIQVEKQLPKMHALYPNLKPVLLMKFDENVVICYDNQGNPLNEYHSTINILQHFYKYRDPSFKEGIVTTSESLPKNPSLSDSSSTKSHNITISTESSKIKLPEKSKRTSHSTVKIYIVKKGDTLSEIAEKNHVGLSKLIKFNGLKTDIIHSGQKLKIPK